MAMDFLYIPLIILLGMGFINLFKKELTPKNFQVLQYLFFFHLLAGTYYCFFIPGDAVGYWRVPKSYSFDRFMEDIFNGEGTMFMYALNFPFTNLLGMSYLSNTLLFSLFGFMGMAFFYMVSVKTIPFSKIINGYALFPLLFFLPNLHIWSVAVGKDLLLFLCIGIFVYGVMAPMKRISLLVLSVLIT